MLFFSFIDHEGRYAFNNQAHIALWNLCVFAQTLLPFIHNDQGKAIDLAAAELMNKNNPSFIRRNHIVERVLKSANTLNLEPFNELLEALNNHYRSNNECNKFKAAPANSERVYQTFRGT